MGLHPDQQKAQEGGGEQGRVLHDGLSRMTPRSPQITAANLPRNGELLLKA